MLECHYYYLVEKRIDDNKKQSSVIILVSVLLVLFGIIACFLVIIHRNYQKYKNTSSSNKTQNNDHELVKVTSQSNIVAMNDDDDNDNDNNIDEEINAYDSGMAEVLSVNSDNDVVMDMNHDMNSNYSTNKGKELPSPVDGETGMNINGKKLNKKKKIVTGTSTNNNENSSDEEDSNSSSNVDDMYNSKENDTTGQETGAGTGAVGETRGHGLTIDNGIYDVEGETVPHRSSMLVNMPASTEGETNDNDNDNDNENDIIQSIQSPSKKTKTTARKSTNYVSSSHAKSPSTATISVDLSQQPDICNESEK